MVTRILSVIIVFLLVILPAALFSACSPSSSKVEPAGPITKTPDEMVLKITDLQGAGWERKEMLPVPEHGAEYAYQVRFGRYESANTTSSEETVFCKVALYYNEAEAHSAFITFRSNYINDTGNEPEEPSLNIGDESFIDTRPVINGTSLLFRKANVNVWLSVNHEYQEDIETLAGIVEERIIDGSLLNEK